MNDRPTPSFRMSELIDQLRTVPDIDTTGVTTVEICEALNVSKSYVHRYLGELKIAGRIRVVRKPIRRLDDTMSNVPAYILVNMEEEDDDGKS